MLKSFSKRLRLFFNSLPGVRLIRTETREHEIFGSEYGGWAVLKNSLGPESIVLSFGIGEDASFDTDLIERMGVSVRAYDPTPASIKWVEKYLNRPEFIFRPIGLSGKDGTISLFLPERPDSVSASVINHGGSSISRVDVPALSLKSIVSQEQLNRIDYLKMDIEGSEYDVIDSFSSLERELLPRQLAVEFHHFFDSIPRSRTRKSVSFLQDIGYRSFWVSHTGRETVFLLCDT